MIYVPDVGVKVDLDRLNKIKRNYIPNKPVIVYSREAANKLLQQGFQIIAVEKNLKRDGDASIFLFNPDNGKTYSALCKILKEMSESKNNLKENLKKIIPKVKKAQCRGSQRTLTLISSKSRGSHRTFGMQSRGSE